MTRVFLIRHGETEWNKVRRLQGSSNVKLSPEGIHQAQMLAANAPFQSLDAIYSSDLVRAVETAKFLANKFGLRVRTMPELRETSFGFWEGKSISDLATAFPEDFGKFFTDPERCQPPHGETFLQCQARVINAMGRIVAANDNNNVAIVSHGAAIRLILCAALDIPIHKMWAISQFNMALNILRIDDGNITVELVNSTAHLHHF